VAHGAGCRHCVGVGLGDHEPVVSGYDANGGGNDRASVGGNPTTEGQGPFAGAIVSAGGAVPRKV
jgi:hypothetical protein